MKKNKIYAFLLSGLILIPNFNSKAFFLVTDIKVAPEIGIETNIATFISDTKLKENKWLTQEQVDKFKIKQKTNFPFTIGCMVGYRFFFVEPEIGFKYHSTKYYELTNLFKFEETQLEIPIRINLHLTLIPGFFGLKVIGGYKFNINKSKYKVTVPKNITEIFGNNPNVKKNIDDISKEGKGGSSSNSGDIILGAGLELPYGMYLNLLVNLPTDIFKIKEITSKLEKLKPEEVNPKDPDFYKSIRLITTTVVELQFGINLIKLIF